MNLQHKPLPPHIWSGDSVAKRYWGLTVALGPIFILMSIFGNADILRILLLSVISAVAFDFLSAKILFKKERVQNGDAVLSAVLLTLLLPSKCPFEIIVLGVFLAVFVAKELFGGPGSCLFHPTLVARLFLQLSFPNLLDDAMILTENGAVWILGALLVGGSTVFLRKKNNREMPFLYMTVYLLCAIFFDFRPESLAALNGIAFTGFFLLGNPVAMPLSRKGTLIFVFGAALLGFFFNPQNFSIIAALFAILAMNAIAPWLDVWLKPIPYKAKIQIKATYP